MNLLEQVRQAVEHELGAWAADPLRYAPELRPLVATHNLGAIIGLAVQLSPPIDPALGRPPGYPWQHGLRVASHALRLCDSAELAGCSPDRVALLVAALFHDLAHTGEGDGHQQAGAELARRELAGHLPAETTARVVRWVAQSDRPGAELELEQKILWDANALDLHGAMFVVRGLSYAGVQGIPPEVLAAVFGAVEGTHRQWSEAAHFETTRRWLRARAATESEFLRRLAEEL